MHGNNLKFSLYRYTTGEDDEIGGANVSGVLLQENINGRFEEAKPSMVLLQQGYATTSIYRGQSDFCQMRELDYLVVTFPIYHPYYGLQFEVLGVQNPSTNPRDGRNMLLFHLQRKDNARNVQS